MASMTQLYQHIAVDQNQLEYKSFTVAGDLYDHFFISKNGNGKNKFKVGKQVGNIKQRIQIPESAKQGYSEEELKKYNAKFQEK
jgi:hypothetical protein